MPKPPEGKKRSKKKKGQESTPEEWSALRKDLERVKGKPFISDEDLKKAMELRMTVELRKNQMREQFDQSMHKGDDAQMISMGPELVKMMDYELNEADKNRLRNLVDAAVRLQRWEVAAEAAFNLRIHGIKIDFSEDQRKKIMDQYQVMLDANHPDWIFYADHLLLLGFDAEKINKDKFNYRLRMVTKAKRSKEP